MTSPRVRPKARTTALLLSAVLVCYLLVVGYRGVLLVLSGRPAFVALGVGVLLLPGIGAYALVRELQFGRATQDLGARMGSSSADSDAAPDFERCRAEVQAHPDSWQGWYSLGLAYDAAGDRSRAREAMRRAIVLAAQEPSGAPAND